MIRFPLSKIEHITTIKDVELHVQRFDLIDPYVSGNKLYKLKLNVDHVLQNDLSGIITFGGAYSNHIAATASYCQQFGIPSIGIIRGEETSPLNPTLSFAKDKGMSIEYVSREAYRQKDRPEYLDQLKKEYPAFWIIPEGGANAMGIKGAAKMMPSDPNSFDHIAVAMGTGTTFAGLLTQLGSSQRLIGIPIHKYERVFEEVMSWYPELRNIPNNRYEIITNAHFGGYAKWNEQLLTFIQKMYREHRLKLDPIYTSKALFAVMEKLEAGEFSEGSKVLFMHTGGLQGVSGFEARHGVRLFE